MLQKERVLTLANIDGITEGFCALIDRLGSSITGKTGLALLETIKRDRLGIGPYPHVTLFEAANRIMSDLVILRGVAWLLREKAFPFDAYTVEFGNEDRNGFDITASSDGVNLVGEAFNVASTFFQDKKRRALRKLREQGSQADYRLMLINHDAVHHAYAARCEERLFLLFVNVRSGHARLVPSLDLLRVVPRHSNPLDERHV